MLVGNSCLYNPTQVLPLNYKLRIVKQQYIWRQPYCQNGHSSFSAVLLPRLTAGIWGAILRYSCALAQVVLFYG